MEHVRNDVQIDIALSLLSLWNNSLIRISILRDYWLETMRDGHKHLLIYLDKCTGVYLNPLLRA